MARFLGSIVLSQKEKSVKVSKMKGFGEKKIIKKKNKKTKPHKEQIINQAIQFHQKGNIIEASKCYQYCINQGFNDYRVFSNFGVILKNLGKLKEAERYQRNAIEIKHDFAEAHSNLGNVLSDLGKLQEAELSYRRAIDIKPDYADAHYNLGIIFRDLGKLQEAELSTRKAIKINPDLAIAHSNLGGILKELGKLQEAEFSYRKAIEINPNFAEAYSNLGFILKDLGKLKEAELSYRKAIEINPNFAKAYYSLSLLKFADTNKTWQDQLFSENILNNKSPKDQVDIYFARSNILHKEKLFEDSSKYLRLANDMKLEINPSNPNILRKKSSALLIESDRKEINKKGYISSNENIFIVGMFRSGSTLIESILTINNDVYDLGEINILEESFVEYKKFKQDISLAKIYEEKVNNMSTLNISTNKCLYNYQYTGIIAQHIPNAKIIHCFRNPLDNILSIYRANFSEEKDYSSSLVDCARVYLDQEELMTKYKKRFRSKIYDLNYDLLVNNPKIEIKTLISWLGWKWDEKYLSPHLNQRSVSTASNVQVRSPINSKSVGSWRDYKQMLKPAIEIITQNAKYRDLNS